MVACGEEIGASSVVCLGYPLKVSFSFFFFFHFVFYIQYYVLVIFSHVHVCLFDFLQYSSFVQFTIAL